MPVKVQTRKALLVSTNFIGLLVLIEVAASFGPLDLNRLGIRPRSIEGLVGIFFAPLLHADIRHLAANALPLWILVTLLFAHQKYRPTRTFSWIWIGSGAGTWLIGRNVGNDVHIGASALIFGITTYLLLSGILMRSWRSFFIALAVFICFGGIFYGLIPQNGMVSWEGHLSGALAGLYIAWRTH